MNDDLEYVNSLEKELDELESEKADFSNIYDLLLEECVSKDVTCSYLHSMSHLNANTELQCMYLHKVKECECLAIKLSKQTESVNKEVHNNLLKSFSKLEKHSISLELSLQHCKEQMKNNPVCKENGSNVFRKEREQYHEIQDLKAQMQDKNLVIIEHMTGNLKLLCNFVEKFLGTVRFGNDQFAPILGYGDLIQGNVTIKRVYYVEGLNHNLFLDWSILLMWIWSLLSGKILMFLEIFRERFTNCSFKSKAVPSSKGRLNLLHMDVCGPMRVASINGKKYILVIVDDYSRYTWTLFLRSKDETPEVLKDFLTMIQRNLQTQVITIRIDKGTEFLNKTLHAYFKEECIEHQTSTSRTPEQNGVVERRNRTLVEAARTMLSASKLPLSFWAEAVATACYTQNRSIIISTHGKTTYHIINDRKPSIKHLHIFGCICYITRDGENLDKMKEKGDPCVMVGYSTQSKGYRVYNKRTRLIVESIHIKFDEIKEMMSDHNSSDLAPQRQEMSVENVSSGLVPQGQKASDYDNSDPVPPRQNVVPSAEKTDSSQQGLEFLFSPLLEEYYNPTHGLAEENNNDQAPNASFQEAELSTSISPTIDIVSRITNIVQLILIIVDSGCTKHDGQSQAAVSDSRECHDQTGLLRQRPQSQSFLDWSIRRLSHLNFNYITLLSKKDVVTGLPKLTYVKDQLCSSCEMSKAKRSSFKKKVVPSSKGRLNLLHMDLCGLMRVASINGKKYILVIVDDYSRYTWTLFL
ncbi:retrovirus-related pol polyprotein from transposon TNT 1-94 [Tanacetum coccineum]